MSAKRRCRVVVGFLMVWAAVASPVWAGAPPFLDRTEVPGAGRSDVLLSIPEAGRYVLTVASSAGVSLALTDRRRGVVAFDGTPGERDGRLDVLLDAGTYRLTALGAHGAQGKARLEARALVELNGKDLPVLTSPSLTSSELGDGQQRSWWLRLSSRGRVELEAAGRCLSDLRVWRDGEWLEEAEPSMATLEPTAGRPLAVRRLVATLEAGSYLVTAYGGVERVWAAGGTERPLYLRCGLPALPASGRRRFVVSALGEERFLLGGKADYLRLELSSPVVASLGVGPLRGDDVFGSSGQSRSLTEKSRLPLLELYPDARGADLHVVTVRAAPGTPFVLQHFTRGGPANFRGGGSFWLAGAVAGNAADRLDGTAVVLRRRRGSSTPTVLAADAVAVDGRRGWARRCTLSGERSVFVDVGEGGTYQVLAEGVELKARLTPLAVLTSSSSAVRPSAWRDAGEPWELDAGLHLLELKVERETPAEVVLTAAAARGTRGGQARPAPRFASLATEPGDEVTVLQGTSGPGPVGLTRRHLPLDLRDALSIPLRGGETVQVPVQVERPGTVRAELEDGRQLPVVVDALPPRPSAPVGAGLHQVAVTAPADTSPWCSLVFVPDSAVVPAPRRMATVLPPSIAPGQERFFELPASGERNFLLRVAEAGLYDISTAGLLATSLRVRTRAVPALAAATDGGTGRNARLLACLGPGEYLVTVGVRGASAGRLGFRVALAEVVDAGTLLAGRPGRVLLPPGAAASFTLETEADGRWQISGLARGGAVPCRVEDAGGWPLLQPGGECDLELDLAAGTTRLLLLPDPVGGRRVVLAFPVGERQVLTGHGPHALPLDRDISHVWVEPGVGEGPRTPDSWTFTLPAPTAVRLELSDRMEGELRRVDGATEDLVARVPMLRGWSGPLAEGRYRLDARCGRPDSGVAYVVGVHSECLVDGLSRPLACPGGVSFAVGGGGGLVELETRGGEDVRARILDGKGKVLASCDDRPDDWNPSFLRRFDPGVYRIVVEAEGADTAATTVSMRLRRERVADVAVVPARMDLALGDDVELVPLELPAGAGTLVVRTTSTAVVGCALERSRGREWAVVGHAEGVEPAIVVPLGAEREASETWLLRLWSADGRPASASLTVAMAPVPEQTVEALADGVAATGLGGLSVWSLTGDGSTLDLADAEGLWWSDESGVSCRAVEDGRVSPRGTRITVAASDGRPTLSGNPCVLPAGASRALTVPGDGAPVRLRVSADGGAVAVRVRSRGGRVAVAPATPDGRLASPATWAASGDGALTLLPGSGVVNVWAAASSSSPLRVVAEAYGLRSGPKAALSDGTVSVTLASGEASPVTLPEGPSSLRLVLGPGGAALVEGVGTSEALVWADGGSRTETLFVTGGRVTFFDVGSRPTAALAALERSPGEQAASVTAEGILRRGAVVAGWARVNLVPPPGAGPWRLRLAGAAVEAVIYGDDGRILDGASPLTGQGLGLIRHGTGAWAAWLEPGAGSLDWYGAGPSTVVDVTPPARVPLGADLTVLRVRRPGPCALHVRTATPTLAMLAVGAGPPAVSDHPHGGRLDAVLPDGEGQVGLRSMGPGPLGGTASVTMSRVTTLAEGLGEATLLAPGDCRFFRLDVGRSGTVGLGVRAEPDTVEVSLLGPGGSLLARGPVLMAELSPGVHHLRVVAPDDGSPVLIRPAVAGLEPPGDGPPEADVRRYLSLDATGGAR